MRLERVFSALAALALAVTVPAQQAASTFSNLSADAGYVAGKVGTAPWRGMADVAANARIDLETDARANEGGTEGGGTEGGIVAGSASFFKFDTGSGTPGPATYSSTERTPLGTAMTGGTSTVTSSLTAPTYYTAPWGASSTPNPSGAGSTASTGTYDPWSITNGSLRALGAAGSPVDLYYQTGLLASYPGFGTTGIGVGPGGSAYYQFQTYALSASGNLPFYLTVTFDDTTGLRFDLLNNGEFDVYLLGGNANDPTADPSARTGAGLLLDANNFDATLRPLFDGNGTPSQDLNFGIIRRFTIPGSVGDDDEVLFDWHTNTFTGASMQAVPGPPALLAFGLGAFLRRRR